MSACLEPHEGAGKTDLYTGSVASDTYNRWLANCLGFVEAGKLKNNGYSGGGRCASSRWEFRCSAGSHSSFPTDPSLLNLLYEDFLLSVRNHSNKKRELMVVLHPSEVIANSFSDVCAEPSARGDNQHERVSILTLRSYAVKIIGHWTAVTVPIPIVIISVCVSL
jgi:hypothetical protein